MCTNADNSVIDSSIFTFNPTTRALTINTSDLAKINLYNLKITGYILDPAKSASITLTVDIRNDCENVVITKASD